jgi:hypothetical protein
METSLRKRIDDLRARRKNVRYEELAAIWEFAGGTIRKTGGRHHVFKIDGRSTTVTYRRPHLSAVYVNRVLDLLEEALE